MNPGRRGFLLGRMNPPAPAAAVIGSSCLTQAGVVCQACRDACETGAISFSWSAGGVPRPLLDAGRCNACAACLEACPARAISIPPAALP